MVVSFAVFGEPRSWREFWSFNFSANAGTIDDLKQQIVERNAKIKEIQEQIARYRDLISAESTKKKSLQNQIYLYNLEIKKLEADLFSLEFQISGLGLEIKKLEAEIQNRESQLIEDKELIAGMLRALNELDREDVFDLVLKHENLSDFFDEYQYASLIQEGILTKIEEVKIIKKELEEKKTANEERKEELEQLEIQLSDRRSILSGQKEERTQLLKETREQEQRYQRLLSETQKKQLEIQKEIVELESKLRYTIDPASIPSYKSGVLSWPLDGRLTQGYGSTSETGFINHAYQFHNGIDIAASFGSPIKAGASGKVVATGDNGKYAYGKWIAIDHENGLVTLYAHLSLKRASTGSRVARGEIIGYEGSSGFSTGPHLHFTVYATNTFYVTDRPYGPLPIGASINPMNYL